MFSLQSLTTVQIGVKGKFQEIFATSQVSREDQKTLLGGTAIVFTRGGQANFVLTRGGQANFFKVRK
jgi:hypothetical protein